MQAPLSEKPKKYVAQLFVASSPQAEVIGQVLMLFLQNLKAEETGVFLKRNGVEAIEPDKWYPQQLLLDIGKDMLESKVNNSENSVALGVQIVDSLPFPPEITTIEAAVTFINIIVKQTTRNVPPEEGYEVVERRPGYLLIVANLPYGMEVVYGYLWAIARKFRPPQAAFQVKNVSNPKPDDHPGIAFEITWH